MTYIYVVVVEDVKTKKAKVSQEGYKTLQAAQRFIQSRSGPIIKLDNWVFTDYETVYTIHEVGVRGA